ncbi:hypothetical protein OG552_33150 [Streptomyces sp. NBC_01476]|uniref:hypothetical protein n=1 Tax=Streptomyces sp. NBC_01476 TaxID=2903881 RepID=UPI002E31681A|nr:hypothetical protein [Streptomyces sp. NBC_01476]
MFPTPSADGACRSAADINRMIRRLSAGRARWTPEALGELARLREQWRAAVDRESAPPGGDPR